MVAFDTTILSLPIFPDAELRQGSAGQKVEHARERVLGLVQQIEEARERVIVPAPALSELLATEGDADVLEWLKGHGKGYQTRINRILRVVMESQPPRSI
jgi:uncharacterized protein (DUF4415 family)